MRKGGVRQPFLSPDSLGDEIRKQLEEGKLVFSYGGRHPARATRVLCLPVFLAGVGGSWSIHGARERAREHERARGDDMRKSECKSGSEK
eukprot:6197540-Pleurochrysis_carterae.AAC.2